METLNQMILKVWNERYKLLKFLFSGGSATAVNFFFLYAFTEWLGFYYLVSVVIAFLMAVCISFFLQKFWTFEDNSKDGIHGQILIFIIFAIINTCINALLVFLSVEYIGLHYMLGQFFSSGLIAFESFFVYKYFIFRVDKAIV